MATKAEFLTALKQNNAIVDKVGPAVLEETTEFGDNIYRVFIRKMKDVRVNYEYVHFVVIKEGQANEAAYFLKTSAINFRNSQEEGAIVNE